jgi:putative restriction endonuclease
MKAGQDLWTREELILAINLYSRIPNGVMHSRNSEVIALSKIIDRSTGAISRKLGNLKRLDPVQQARGQFGLKKGGNLEVEIWNEFYGNIESFAFQSEVIRAEKEFRTIDSILEREPELNEIFYKQGTEREQLIKIRVNQAFFREMVLAAYDGTCCITGLNEPKLLVAGHIRRWADDEKHRMNPHNGLAINALHDKAFEIGLITITPDYLIKVSPKLRKKGATERVEELFLQYDGKGIYEPKKFWPDVEFLADHNKNVFKG